MMMSMAIVTEERRWAFPEDIPVELELVLDAFDGVLLFADVDVAVESVNWVGVFGSEVVDGASVIFERVFSGSLSFVVDVKVGSGTVSNVIAGVSVEGFIPWGGGFGTLDVW
jgi:hypothetical protein